MSYSATAALIAFYSWWSGAQKRGGSQRNYPSLAALPMKAANHIGAIAMTSLVAGGVSSIFAAYHFNNTAPFGLIGNALALPVISTLVMPFAVLGLLAMPFDLDWLPFAVMGYGIEAVIAIAQMVASHSPSGNLGLMPQGTLVFMSIGLVLLLVLSTRLRLCGIPLLLGAAIWMMRTQEPDIMIAEEGKLVAIRTESHRLAINRSSGSAFTLNNWQQGYGINDVVRPSRAADIQETQFACTDKLCTARERGGLIIAYTDDPAQRSLACAEGDIVVLAFTGTEAFCSESDTLVVTKRDLALRGGVEIRLHASRSKPFRRSRGADAKISAQQLLPEAHAEHIQRLVSATITHAVGPPDRPWNSYRIYSRAARNFEDYKSSRTRDANSE